MKYTNIKQETLKKTLKTSYMNLFDVELLQILYYEENNCYILIVRYILYSIFVLELPKIVFLKI